MKKYFKAVGYGILLFGIFGIVFYIGIGMLYGAYLAIREVNASGAAVFVLVVVVIASVVAIRKGPREWFADLDNFEGGISD